MKIKTKKQFTLPQLIEWLLKSGYRNYTANSNMGNIVTLSRYGAIQYAGHDDKSINRVLFANPESVETTHFYIENDNQELVLIWRDGKLI